MLKVETLTNFIPQNVLTEFSVCQPDTIRFIWFNFINDGRGDSLQRPRWSTNDQLSWIVLYFYPINFWTKVSKSASSLRPTNLSMTFPSFIPMTVGTAWTCGKQSSTTQWLTISIIIIIIIIIYWPILHISPFQRCIIIMCLSKHN